MLDAETGDMRLERSYGDSGAMDRRGWWMQS